MNKRVLAAVPARLRNNAKKLRKEMTEAEKKIWSLLRAHRLTGTHFRRQVPIGAYITDFASHKPRLVIEIDGGVTLKILEVISASPPPSLTLPHKGGGNLRQCEILLPLQKFSGASSPPLWGRDREGGSL